MKKVLLAVAAILAVSSPAMAQRANVGVDTDTNNANTNNNNSNANSQADGGDSRNQNVNLIDGSEEVDSFYLNLQQVYPKNLNNLQNGITNNLGNVFCQGDVSGSSVRIGFPPSIVFDNQKGENLDCNDALAQMSKYTQSEVYVKLIQYIQTNQYMSTEYRRLAIEELNRKVLALFLSDAVELEHKARTSSIQQVKTILIENQTNWEERSRLAKEAALVEGRQVPLDYVPPELPPLDQCDMNNPND